jgi:hypothetical protein
MIHSRKPNLKAPRFRRNTAGTLNKDFIKELKQKVPAARDFTDKKIKEIITAFNGVLWEEAINKRDGVEIPEQIGHLFIGTCPAKKRKNVDFKQTASYMEVIQHRNYESDQHLAKIFYTTYSTFGTKYRFKNHELWGFIATRDFKRTVGKTYPLKWKQYLEVNPNIKISSMFRSNIYKIERKEADQLSLQNYDEFEI